MSLRTLCFFVGTTKELFNLLGRSHKEVTTFTATSDALEPSPGLFKSAAIRPGTASRVCHVNIEDPMVHMR